MYWSWSEVCSPCSRHWTATFQSSDRRKKLFIMTNILFELPCVASSFASSNPVFENISILFQECCLMNVLKLVRWESERFSSLSLKFMRQSESPVQSFNHCRPTSWWSLNKSYKCTCHCYESVGIETPFKTVKEGQGHQDFSIVFHSSTECNYSVSILHV